MADPLSSFTGLSSGMDWRSLVEQVIALDRRPADALKANVATNDKRKAALSQLQGLVQAVKDSAESLRTGASFDAFKVTATGSDATGRAVLAATASATATPGTFDVTVTALARAQKTTAGAGFAPAAAVNAAGTLRLTRGATTYDVAVASTDTLAAVRDKINALNAGAAPSGVVASLVNVSATDQRLVLTAAGTGAAGAFTLGDDGTSGLLGTFGFDPAHVDPTKRPVTTAARDAALTVDGVPVTRPTNTVSDVVPGATFTLTAEGTSSVLVERYNAAASEAVKGFVDAYNKVQEFIAGQGKGDAAASPLRNDSMLRTVRSSLSQRAVTASTPTPGNGVKADLASLGALGVSLQQDGKLLYTPDTFEKAFAGRLGDVKALLADKMAQYTAYADELAQPLTGLIDRRESTIDAQNVRYTDRAADIESRLEKKRAALIAQYAKFESTLSRMKALGDSLTTQLKGLTAGDSNE